MYSLNQARQPPSSSIDPIGRARLLAIEKVRREEELDMRKRLLRSDMSLDVSPNAISHTLAY